PRPPHPSTPFPTRRSSDLTNGADYAGRPGGALRTSLSLSASRTRRALLSQRGPISAFNRGDVRVRTLGRPGRTVEKNRVIGQVVRRIVPCAEPIQPFRPRRTRKTSRASWTLWPLGTGCTFRPLRTNGADRCNRSEEHTSELQSRFDLVCRLLLEKKKLKATRTTSGLRV